jgi:hypothetical protein
MTTWPFGSDEASFLSVLRSHERDEASHSRGNETTERLIA